MLTANLALGLRPANSDERAFSEALSRGNMRRYLEAREIAWDPQRFIDSWAQFENYMIYRNDMTVGLLRLLEVDRYLEIRDLQLLPEYCSQGIGSWAVAQAAQIAMQRGIIALRLRVYEENPARQLYGRLGFETVAISEGLAAPRTFHMVRELTAS